MYLTFWITRFSNMMKASTVEMVLAEAKYLDRHMPAFPHCGMLRFKMIYFNPARTTTSSYLRLATEHPKSQYAAMSALKRTYAYLCLLPF
jgi:hypothetical protein